MTTPWEILGVHRKSTDKEIQAAFHELAWRTHPDAGDDIQQYTIYNDAYQAIKNKDTRERWLVYNKMYYTPCSLCSGVGAKSKSKGLTGKVYTTCKVCKGGGLIARKHKEKKDVITQLRGTSGSGSKRRNKKR